MKETHTVDLEELRSELSTVLHDAGVDGVRIYEIFNMPIGDSKLPATERQIHARSDFALTESKLRKQLEELETMKFPILTTKKKRAQIIEALTKEISDTLTELNYKYYAVLVTEQTREWSIYKGNVYRNSYQYVEDGPHEIPSLYEYKALKVWREKVNALTS
jgi:hypothetical protein